MKHFVLHHTSLHPLSFFSLTANPFGNEYAQLLRSRELLYPVELWVHVKPVILWIVGNTSLVGIRSIRISVFFS